MGTEFLSIAPQRVRCYVCGAFTESPDRWSYRVRLRGASPVCPTCTPRVEQEIEQLTSNPNLVGAVALGALAAAVGSAAWYGFAVGGKEETGVIAVGIGLLVGKAVAFGSGNKRGPSLQAIAGVLAGSAVLAGQYLILNYFSSKLQDVGSVGWLSWKQSLILFGRVLAHRNRFLHELLFLLGAASCAQISPRADKLTSKPPTRRRGWPFLAR